MNKSREFENILNKCLERLLVKGESLEQCLQSYPEYSQRLRPLLETALSVNQLSVIQPTPEFRDRARHQFYAALKENELKKSHSPFAWAWQPRWAVSMAIVLVLAVCGGTVAASGNSLPDEPLYSVKLATEQVQLFFTRSAVSKAELYAELADKRVAEIVSMADENKPEQIEQAAERLDNYLTRIADLTSNQEEAEAEGMVMAPITEKAIAPETEETPPPEAVPPVEEEAAPEAPPVVEEVPVLSDMGEQASRAQIEADPLTRLKVTVTVYATDHPERLRSLLETVPPSTRQALRRAIAISEAGYEKILKSLD